MKTYTVKELREILDNHKRWLYNREGTQERANLRGANLCDANLRDANLRDANLYDADLCDADLRGANLYGANLYGANLRGADLCDADLRCANLCDADLRGANLRDANLYGADLRGADLCDADLYGVNGNLRHVKSLQTETYYITYTAKIIQIGCQRHTIEEWRNFDDKRILGMDGRKALEWWNKWKPILMQIIELAPCKETK